MVTFYNYPKKQWRLRTTNPVESPFAALRLRTDAAKRFKKVENAQAVIWKMLLVAEKRFRRLKAPELMKDVYQGAQYVNGVPVNQAPEEKPPDVFPHLLTRAPGHFVPFVLKTYTSEYGTHLPD